MADTAGGRGTQSLRRSGGQSGERHANSVPAKWGHSKRKARLSRQRPHAFGDKAVRLLILSEVDPGVYIKSCATMTCATEKRESGPGSNKAWVITALRRLLEANGRLIDDEASAEQAARMRHNDDFRQGRAKASSGMRRSGSTRKMVIE